MLFLQTNHSFSFQPMVSRQSIQQNHCLKHSRPDFPVIKRCLPIKGCSIVLHLFLLFLLFVFLLLFWFSSSSASVFACCFFLFLFIVLFLPLFLRSVLRVFFFVWLLIMATTVLFLVIMLVSTCWKDLFSRAPRSGVYPPISGPTRMHQWWHVISIFIWTMFPYEFQIYISYVCS